MKESTTISYFNISWLSEFDGPGKRVVVFLQGCKLDCAWCHSPHSQPSSSPLLFHKQFCVLCRKCASVCKNNVHLFVNENHLVNRQYCNGCGSCVEACPNSFPNLNTGALYLPTKRVDVDVLFNLLKPQLELVKKSGGITISGGEPLTQPVAAAALAQRCKDNGIHTTVETSGIAEKSEIEILLPFVDTWLVGFRLHRGIDKEPSAEMEVATRLFLSIVSKKPNVGIIGRIPVIPGYTDRVDYLNKVTDMCYQFNISNIELLPHNPESAHYYSVMGTNPIIHYNKEQADAAYLHMKEFFYNHHKSLIFN